MTKKKRGHPDVEEVLARPWCYYCERDFDDIKILISHQKAKHFKCERCGRRLNTAGGLSVHMSQVHKENLTTVENSLPNRADHNIEIFGIHGIPEDVAAQHKARVTQQFYEAEAARRANSGNPPPGGNAGAGGPKKPKIESISEMKARLAEHKARKAAQEADAAAGNSTPTSSGPGMASPGPLQSPAHYQTGSSFTQQPHSYQQQQDYAPQPGFPPPPFAHQGYPPHSPYAPPYAQGMPGFPPPPHQFPPGPNPYPQMPMPMQHFPHQGGAQHPGPYPPYGANSPGPYTQPRPAQSQSPSMHGSSLPRPPSLMTATSGLPHRPAFVPPPVNAFQMQQMHQGHVPGQDPRLRPSNDPAAAASPSQSQSQPTPRPEDNSITASAVDDLIADSAKGASALAHIPDPAGEDKVAVATTEAKKSTSASAGKKDKDKDKATKMIYADNEVSPEEKMAGLERYKFDAARDKNTQESTLDDAGIAAGGVAGVVAGPDDVLDRTG